MGVALPIRGDIEAAELRRLARRERDGRVSARLLVLANALEGMSREAAARAAGMDRQTLRDWVVRFNAEGTAGLRDQPRPGRPTRMTEGQQAAFKAIVLRGPAPERDGVSAWRIADLCRIAEERLGVVYQEGGMLRLVKALDLSWQKTRPRHPRADGAAQERFKKDPMGHRTAERWLGSGSDHLDQEAPMDVTPAMAPLAEAAPATLFVALELSRSTWLVAMHSPIGDKISQHRLEGGDTEGLLKPLTRKRMQAAEKPGRPVRVGCCFEAGYDGFWLHRWLCARGIDNRMLDAASLLVDRRARRAKADRAVPAAGLAHDRAVVQVAIPMREHVPEQPVHDCQDRQLQADRAPELHGRRRVLCSAPQQHGGDVHGQAILGGAPRPVSAGRRGAARPG